MSKKLSLLFAVLSTLILIGIGASLSYRNLWIAAALLIIWVGFLGFSFIVKARKDRRRYGDAKK
ncbi:DUF5325 family protein [Paenibacillus gansuensis]|uniref:DUF5325 family protein n=1 Tax=Paenibacillus gansuensis TaxID=306542 RepID=A0ABW5PGA0_9BACL